MNKLKPSKDRMVRLGWLIAESVIGACIGLLFATLWLRSQ